MHLPRSAAWNSRTRKTARSPSRSTQTEPYPQSVRTSGYYMNECKGVIQAGQRDSRENYDIRIDEKTGDVTIRLTHYENSQNETSIRWLDGLRPFRLF